MRCGAFHSRRAAARMEDAIRTRCPSQSPSAARRTESIQPRLLPAVEGGIELVVGRAVDLQGLQQASDALFNDRQLLVARPDGLDRTGGGYGLAGLRRGR